MIKWFLLLILISYPAFAQVRQIDTSTQGQRQDITITTGARQKLPVARAFAYAPRPTSDCMGSFGAGVQGTLAGITFNGTKQSQPCNDRENAESVAALGMVDMAQRMRIIAMCEDARYKKLDECIELKDEEETKKVCDYPTKCTRLGR